MLEILTKNKTLMKTTTFLIFFTTIAISNSYTQNSRPQEPQDPFGYTSENIIFENKMDGIMLAGTFTYPKTGTNFPAAVLISGSGPQDRNSEIMGHKPFLLLSDYLTNNGIAVLRVDDRGVGESEGIYNEAGLDNFVRDTKATLDYLQTRNEVDKSKIGLIGHSLGGIIAPIIADGSDSLSYIVLLAASGIPGNSLMLLQKEKIERKMGVPEISIAVGQNNMKGAYEIILGSKDNREELVTQLKDYFSSVFGAMVPESQINSISESLSLPWLVDFIKFNPQDALKNTKCAVLALNGSNDVQVPAKENLEAIGKILEENGNRNFEIIELENLNHLFQESETGLPNEYETIEQTFSPDALKIISDWIIHKTK